MKLSKVLNSEGRLRLLYKAACTSVYETKTNAKRIMCTCRRTAFAFIRLCDVCSANRQMLSVWSRYFKGKYVRNRTDVEVHSFGQPTNDQWNACSFACAANAEQATFWHSFAFASVSHALFAFAYRCGRLQSAEPVSTGTLHMLQCVAWCLCDTNSWQNRPQVSHSPCSGLGRSSGR